LSTIKTVGVEKAPSNNLVMASWRSL